MNQEQQESASGIVKESDTGCTNTSCCPPQAPVMRSMPKIGRNDPCACNSGRKFKKCCGKNS